MTTEEFSNEFDILINSFSAQNPISFDEYEKSIYLTNAQDKIVKELYEGRLSNDSFEKTEQLRRYLSELVKTDKLPCKESTNGLSNTSVFAELPKDVLFITYESVTLDDKCPCINDKQIEVIPVTQDEYHRIKDNPFRQANSRRALRLDIDESTVELISKYTIKEYLVRYIAKPDPIILVDLPDGLTINKINKRTECKLNPAIHRMILEVAISEAARSINSKVSR